MAQRNFFIPPQRYLTSKPYPADTQEEVTPTPSFVESYFHRIYYDVAVAEAVNIAQSYVPGSMKNIKVLDYQQYYAQPEAVSVGPQYIDGSMKLILTKRYKEYSDAPVEAMGVQAQYIDNTMSMPTVIQYIQYRDYEVEAVGVNAQYISGTMQLKV